MLPIAIHVFMYCYILFELYFYSRISNTKYRSAVYTKLIENLFALDNKTEKLEYVLKNNNTINQYMQDIFRKHFPALKRDYKFMIWVLMFRLHMYEIRSDVDRMLDLLSQLSHRYFMCVVFQLTTDGKIVNQHPVEQFSEFFDRFVLLLKHTRHFNEPVNAFDI